MGSREKGFLTLIFKMGKLYHEKNNITDHYTVIFCMKKGPSCILKHL